MILRLARRFLFILLFQAECNSVHPISISRIPSSGTMLFKLCYVPVCIREPQRHTRGPACDTLRLFYPTEAWRPRRISYNYRAEALDPVYVSGSGNITFVAGHINLMNPRFLAIQ